MLPASSVRDFLSAPLGRYYCGRRHAVFAHSPTLIGFASWGYPDVDDVRELLKLCEIGVAPGAVPHRFIVDLRALELIDPRTFGMFVDFTRGHREALARNVLGQAQLRPEGLVGAIISGFSHVARLPYPERVFGDVADALAWLELDHDLGTGLLDELTRIRDAASGTDGTVRCVRAELDSSHVRPLGEVATRLGLSRRTLQRALRDAGTTFRLESRSAWLRRAQSLLRDGDRNLSWVAAELGFSSVQHFSTAFRRALGETPSTWRARHRP